MQGQWNEIKGSLKSHWGALTSDDLRAFNGDVDQLIGKIQRKTGETREVVQQYLEQLTADTSSFVSATAERARDLAQQATESVHDAYDNVSDQVRDGYAGAQEIVRSRPAESMVVAFGAGMFAGLIVGLVMRQR